MSFLQQLQQAIGRAPLGWRPSGGSLDALVYGNPNHNVQPLGAMPIDIQPLGITPIDNGRPIDIYPLGITPIDNGKPIDVHPLGITPIDIGYPQPLGVTPIDVGFPQPPQQTGGKGLEQLFKALLLFLIIGLVGRR